MIDSATDNTTATGWTKIDTAMIHNMVAIGRAEFSVYCVLAALADHSGECFPSVAHIAKAVGISERSVRRAVSRLIDLDYVVKVIRNGGHGETRSNTYRLPLLAPPRPGGHERRGRTSETVGPSPKLLCTFTTAPS